MQDQSMSAFAVFFNLIKLTKMEWENNGKDEKESDNGLINLVSQAV